MDKGFDVRVDDETVGRPADSTLKAWIKPAAEKADVAKITAGAPQTTVNGDSMSSCAS